MALATLRPPAARRPASFEMKLAQLIASTAAPDWDDEGGQAIPADRWERVREIVAQVRVRLPALPDPFPSPGGDGSRHLRWSFGGNLFDMELPEHGRAIWARNIGTEFTSGATSSPAELFERLEETFS